MEKGFITRGKIGKYVRVHKFFGRARKSLVFRNPLYPSIRQGTQRQYPR